MFEPGEEQPAPDLVPNKWITIDYSTCWYPLNFRISTIKSLARSQANPDFTDWKELKIQIIEKDIGINIQQKNV